jgi:hypothetical protein
VGRDDRALVGGWVGTTAALVGIVVYFVFLAVRPAISGNGHLRRIGAEEFWGSRLRD